MATLVWEVRRSFFREESFNLGLFFDKEGALLRLGKRGRVSVKTLR